MCAMALVHSRIKAVFYGRANRDLEGGMNEHLQVNSLAQLNHRFPVYRMCD